MQLQKDNAQNHILSNLNNSEITPEPQCYLDNIQAASKDPMMEIIGEKESIIK